ncbi:NAD(P)-dependent oxidoreductase [Tessaracoccus sp. MC1756]|uniref:NAD-dependent epimerase/dehydratase family protein n=1 Tax=Tessaracoccus sp. MC1756 TaxID=2760311 RepID=UPI0016025F67|nr:NAD(P)-dependent oxidoreductase [Tessaracoccus sp. MC1756]MBB1510388.1 NAD(P)-dependent oxidoreductase [Tessaracoccus sp. MC1756]
MADNKRRILITGATGGIGLLLEERLMPDYDVISHGRTPANDEQAKRLRKADLEDYDEVRTLMDGVEVVLHLAGQASPEAEWDEVVGPNIIGFRNVLEAARDAGVRRFVFASSNHAMGMYDRDEDWPVYPHHLPRPDSLYGVSKVFGEALGRYYHDKYGMEFISLRIGWSTEDPLAAEEELLHAMWLSNDDTERVFRRAIEAENIGYGLYYAISDNPNRRWDLTNTMLELGYRPEDSVTDLEKEDVVEGGHGTPDNWPEGS